MQELAYAKINLSLDVLRRRADGYHELSMIMFPLTFHDTLTIEISDEDCYSCDIPLVFDEKNTIVKAVQLMRNTYQLKEHFRIHCEKVIPMEAGLGGGSADAAAVLRAINRLCKLNLSLTELAELGKKIGADVPFCVMNQAAYVSGIGEKIEPFDLVFDYEILLVKHQRGVSTAQAFQSLDFNTAKHYDVRQIVEALKANDEQKWLSMIGNTLEQSAFKLVEEIKQVKEQMLDDGFDAVLMSGSGSALFGLTKNKQLISACMERNH